MRRCRKRVSRNIVVGMTQSIRKEEHHCREENQSKTEEPAIFRCVERMERNRILLAFHVNACWVARSRNMQCPDVHDDNAGNHKWQQIVKREETVQRSIIRCKSAQKQFLNRLADQRNSLEQTGNDLRTPEAHLSPRKHIAHESRFHRKQIDDYTEQPDHLTRRFIRAVIKTAADMQINGDEEEARAVGVSITDHPATIYVTHNMLDRIKRNGSIGGIVHRQYDAGYDLDDQKKPSDRTEVPHIVKVTRRRIASAKTVINQTANWQSIVNPLTKFGRWFILLCPRKTHFSCP